MTFTIIVDRGISFKHLVLYFLITVQFISGRSLLFEFRIKFRKMNTYAIKRNKWILRFGLTTAVLPEVSTDDLLGVRVVVFTMAILLYYSTNMTSCWNHCWYMFQIFVTINWRFIGLPIIQLKDWIWKVRITEERSLVFSITITK